MKIITAKDDDECASISYDILLRFSEEIRFPFRPDKDSVHALVSGRTRFDRFVILDSGECVGGMLCIKLQHPVNWNVSISSEIFFHINKEYRGGSSAIRMLGEYSQWCFDERVNICTLISTPNSPIGIDSIYKRYGFYPNERTFVRWQV